MRIGLLGGSFNPAHAGHRYIALQALKRLGLDQVWILVSPQNPLKSKADMAPQGERIASCHAIMGGHPQIRITSLENKLRTQYTADTLSTLTKRYRGLDFVWIMGADNLASFHRWKDHTRILSTCRIAIFHRPPYSLRALSSQTAHRYARAQQTATNARTLWTPPAPAWTFIRLRGMALSATEIRAKRLHTF